MTQETSIDSLLSSDTRATSDGSCRAIRALRATEAPEFFSKRSPKARLIASSPHDKKNHGLKRHHGKTHRKTHRKGGFSHENIMKTQP